MLPRRTLLPLLLLAGCASPAPPPGFPQLRFDYLAPLLLNVATVDIQNNWQPISPQDVGHLSPAPPAATLARMGYDRLKPAGGSGRAVFSVDDASVVQNGDVVNAQFAVHVDILDPSGARLAYAQARAVRTRSGVPRGGERRAAILYDIVKQMMDVMNVELEYQVRKNLSAFLVSNAAPPVPGPVEAAPLPAPGT